MYIPIVSGFNTLGQAPRRFLIYVAINVVSWQNIVGPVMVLLARKIDMPESFVGLMISFMPFTTLLLLFTLPLIVRLGPKRVMMWAWFLRNVITCSVFLLPLALLSGSKEWAWIVLAVSILGFCVMRALGAGGWLPWLHEIVPVHLRSTYFSTETSIAQIINIVVLFIQARLLAVDDPGISRFLLIYAIGIAMGFISLFWMRRIPGGAGNLEIDAHIGMRAYGRAISDRNFLVFLLVSMFSLSGMTWYGASFIMYLRDNLDMRDSMTLMLTVAGSLGILFTVGAWARFTEANGSGLAMAKTLFGHTSAPVLMVLAVSGASSAPCFSAVSVVFASIFGAAFGVAVNRAMLNQVPDHDRIGYTALWTVGTAIAFGVTPVAAGLIIEHFPLWGFQACFILSAVSTSIAGVLCLFLVHDVSLEGKRWFYLLNPLLPLRTAGRIMWITVGLHESNQDLVQFDVQDMNKD
jgi:MFS family permease